MKNDRRALPFLSLTLSMVIFGTIGVFRRLIPLGSATLAGVRGLIGAAAILLLLLVRGRKPDGKAVRGNLFPLLLSGAFIGINWILLFEAYERTTVAAATLSYYMAPPIAILLSCAFLKEKISLRKGLCILAAVIGMVGVSGVLNGGVTREQLSGIGFGLAAAFFYACVIVLNQKLSGIGAFDKTLLQLFSAAVVVAPYALLTEPFDPSFLRLVPILLTLTVGVVHTGIAYALYFGSMSSLSVQTVSLMGYVDPIVAVLLSVTVLKEPMGVFEFLGVLLILGALILGETGKKERPEPSENEKDQ